MAIAWVDIALTRLSLGVPDGFWVVWDRMALEARAVARHFWPEQGRPARPGRAWLGWARPLAAMSAAVFIVAVVAYAAVGVSQVFVPAGSSQPAGHNGGGQPATGGKGGQGGQPQTWPAGQPGDRPRADSRRDQLIGVHVDQADAGRYHHELAPVADLDAHVVADKHADADGHAHPDGHADAHAHAVQHRQQLAERVGHRTGGRVAGPGRAEPGDHWLAGGQRQQDDDAQERQAGGGSHRGPHADRELVADPVPVPTPRPSSSSVRVRPAAIGQLSLRLSGQVADKQAKLN